MPLVVPQVALRMYDIVVQLLPKVAVMIYYVFVVQLVGTQLLCVVCSAVGGNWASDGHVMICFAAGGNQASDGRVWFVLQLKITKLVMVMCVICSAVGGNQTSDGHVCDLQLEVTKLVMVMCDLFCSWR